MSGRVPDIRWGGAAPSANRDENAVEEDGVSVSAKEGEWGGELWLGRQALHAARLTVTHPATGEVMTFDAPLPVDMRRACAALGLDADAPW